MLRKLLSLAILVTIVFCATARSEWQGRCHWTDASAAATHDYHDADNWIGTDSIAGQNIVPNNYVDPSDPLLNREYDVFIDLNNVGPIVNADITANVVHMGGAAWVGAAPATDTNMTIQSGNVNISFWFVIGEQFGSNGTLNMEGGSLYVGGDLMFGAHNGGSGTLNMTGGSIDVAQLFSAFFASGDSSQQVGMINLNGGTINVRGGVLALNERGKMDMTAGTLTLDGDHRWGISDLSSWGLLTAYDGAGSLLLSYDNIANVTTVTATTDEMYVDKFDTYADDAAIASIWASSANASIALGGGHADGNSLALTYDNTAAPFVAETTKTFAGGKDFTANNMHSMDIWFNGEIGNSIEQIYITLEDGSGATETINYDGDVNDIATDDWFRWILPYVSMSIDLTDIVSYTIGIGNGAAGGSGIVEFDSAMMYNRRGSEFQADLNNDDKVNLEDLAIMASEWLQVSL